MPDEPGKTYDPKKIIQTAQAFFSACSKEKVPLVLQGKGKWSVLNGGWFWSLFYLTEHSLNRLRDYEAKKWHPFPGLFSPAETGPGLIKLDGKNAFLDSCVTKNGYAIRVGRNATFILHNHHHSIHDDQGHKADYRVDLAFVIGVNAASEYPDLETAFHPLFQRFTDKLSSGR